MRWVALLTLLLTGCATQPVSSFHTHKNLHVELSKNDKHNYSLVDQKGKRVSRSNGRSASLNFSIPPGTRASSCFAIADHKGKNIFGEGYYFSLPLTQEYRKVDTSRKNLGYKLDIAERAEKENKRRYNAAWDRLEANPAFKDNTCHKPPRKPFPRKPRTKCKTEKECREEGGAICFSRFLGTEGCSIALKELQIPGLLSAPGCAAVAADLAGEKYGMEDAFVDFLHGVADDYADSLMQSESGLSQLFGLIVKGANYKIKLDKAEQCTHQFVNRFYGPKRKWLAEVDRIKSEPARVQSTCFSIIREVNDYHKKIDESKQETSTLAKELAAAKRNHERLSAIQRPLTRCRG